MKRSPGFWALRGHQIRADHGNGPHVASYQISRADGMLLAAAPEMFEMLLDACKALDAAESNASSHGTACYIRDRLAALGLIRLGLNEYGHPSCREDPADTDLEIP